MKQKDIINYMKEKGYLGKTRYELLCEGRVFPLNVTDVCSTPLSVKIYVPLIETYTPTLSNKECIDLIYGEKIAQEEGIETDRSFTNRGSKLIYVQSHDEAESVEEGKLKIDKLVGAVRAYSLLEPSRRGFAKDLEAALNTEFSNI
jgi:hypothetical protein